MRGYITLLVVLAATTALCAGLGSEARRRMVQSGRVGEDVVAALDVEPTVRIMVAFALPGAAHGLDAAGRAAMATTREAILGSVGDQLFHVRHTYGAVNAVAGDATADGILALLAREDVLRIDIDAPGSGDLLQALPLMTVSDVKALGYGGAGITVAVIDSGIDTTHPDLADDIVGEACFCSGSGGCCPGGRTRLAGPGSAEDDNGHGTNVGGIITGDGTVAPEGGAPAAKIVAVKVLDSSNLSCCSSDVVAALDLVIMHHPEVRVVNMSLGTSALFPGTCDGATAYTMAYATAIDTLRANGTLTFVSSGNQGSSLMMAAPACIANAVSVGAVWDSNLGPQLFLGCTDVATAADQVTCFTNSDLALDVVAPGAFTTATGIGGGISTYGGTSQASPAAASCAADLLEAVPTLTPADVEAALKASPTRVIDRKNGLSFPRIDCRAALSLARATTTSTTTTSTTTSSTSATSTTTTSTSTTSTSTTSASSTSTSSTSTSSTSTTTSTTSTTLPEPCTTVRCRLEDVLHVGPCSVEPVPPRILRKIDRGLARIDEAAALPPKPARRVLGRAWHLLNVAGREALRSSRAPRPKLSAACAAAIRAATKRSPVDHQGRQGRGLLRMLG